MAGCQMMSKFSERGYFVKENGPVYFTLDMDKTVEWFETFLVGIVKLMSVMTKEKGVMAVCTVFLLR